MITDHILPSNIISETSFEEHDQSILHFNQVDNTERFHDGFHDPELQQLNTIPEQQQNISTLQILPDLFDTSTVQNVSELSDNTIKITQLFTITNDSNV